MFFSWRHITAHVPPSSPSKPEGMGAGWLLLPFSSISVLWGIPRTARLGIVVPHMGHHHGDWGTRTMLCKQSSLLHQFTSIYRSPSSVQNFPLRLLCLCSLSNTIFSVIILSPAMSLLISFARSVRVSRQDVLTLVLASWEFISPRAKRMVTPPSSASAAFWFSTFWNTLIKYLCSCVWKDCSSGFGWTTHGPLGLWWRIIIVKRYFIFSCWVIQDKKTPSTDIDLST